MILEGFRDRTAKVAAVVRLGRGQHLDEEARASLHGLLRAARGGHQHLRAQALQAGSGIDQRGGVASLRRCFDVL
jgi:hypothetical protein